MFQDRYSLAFKLYPYERSADQDADSPVRHPVVVMGGGPIGVAMALDLGLQGIPVVVLDDHEGIGMGSRAICFAKRSMEIAGRYGCGEPMLDKGVVWNLGKVFHKEGKVFEFNLLPEEGHKYPAFINLQQPYFEKFLVDRVREAQAAGAPIELRGKNRVDSVTEFDDYVELQITTPDGEYKLQADWLIGADGASSPLRGMLGLDFEGRVFEDSFLIADIKMTADFPTERWFWFEPTHGSGASTLLHKQPDDTWRIDFQIGWDVDRKEEMKEENIRARLDAMLGDVDYEMVWSSIYTFQCKRMDQFRHGRVIFAGDSAHQVSPFGARGANSGMQDVDNLGWKLGMVIRGEAPERLIDTYSEERVYGADENILNSTRATDFITPKSKISHTFRNAVLSLAGEYEFARPLVNSGRLSVPCTYDGLSLNGPDDLTGGPARTRVGSACPDAPLGAGYLLSQLGNGFQILTIDADAPDEITVDGVTAKRLAITASDDATGALTERYLGDAASAVYLIRPDQHVAARWDRFDEQAVQAALQIACGKEVTA
ncbi:3-(3-hydroxy-phenyl)propionate/3-hydroxycinnamic acid hydroxylase [Pelagimonas phthalicica]|uniref:3-(3-hydroxy-phenyl)propionate/3-hydroxycinnamic acid hydroxylase n=1 Tax=Pelagimonas phthalicica TaxID=1037362 RepID=A0A238J5Z0_9RHOB|nr:FAD-dependent oxidoreductase [Pelagimonas phthalicica]TDS95408.1 3-(3-hydroxy-phenyl)propionate hydroxylase [Pelagimonas phthalicica]SMX26068.1 3-(3-hydroxy-phenyl)propionate/3-hydroxycinnamic acid hydroxylase [Pelagimonas phthalicica]